MNNKKIGVFLIGFLVLNIFTFALVSAAPDANTLISGVQGFFTPLLNALFGQNSSLFELLLFALIIIAASYMALERVPVIRENPFAMWTLTLATAVLSTRYIGMLDIVKVLLFPQGVFGIAIISIIPFVLYFWFVEFGLTSKTMRKFAWAMFIAVFAVLWYNQFYIMTPDLASWGSMYLIAAGLGVLCLVFDGTIKGAIKKSKAEAHLETMKERELSRLNKEREVAIREEDGPALEGHLEEIRKKTERVLKWR